MTADKRFFNTVHEVITANILGVVCHSLLQEGDFLFLGSKITADGDWSHEIRRQLLLGRKVMKNLDSLLKSRDITLPTEVHIVKAMASQWLYVVVRARL